MKKFKKRLIGILLISLFLCLISSAKINSDLNSDITEQEKKIDSQKHRIPQESDDFNPPPAIPNENFLWDFENGTEIGFIYERYNENDYYKSAGYYNITSMPLIFSNATEQNETAYCVQLEELYYNSTLNKILPVLNTPFLNVSLTNFTASFGSMNGYVFPMSFPEDEESDPFLGWYFMLNPFIPNNGTELAFNWSAERLALLYSYMMSGADIITIKDRNLYLKNLTSGAYINLTYGEDGILTYGEMYSFDDEDAEWYTITLRSTFDINPIDDVEWAVDVGDYMYYGLNRNELRFNITQIVNKTYVDEDHGVTLVFQEVWANVSRWEEQNQQWMDNDEILIGRANEFFPIVPFDEGEDSHSLPILMPEGFKLSELLTLYKVSTDENFHYDSAAIEDNWIIQYNSSNNGFVKFLYNASGILELIQAVNFEFMTDDGKLGDNVLYLKNSTSIDTSNLIWEFDIRTLGTEAFNVSLNISVIDDTHLLTSAFSVNPINISLNYGVLFIDVWLNNTNNLDTGFKYPINITIEFDPSVYKNIEVWYFNTSSFDPNEAWKQLPFEVIASGKIVISVNHTSIFVFTNIPISLISDDDGDGKKKKDEAIPFGHYYLLFLTLAIIGLVIYKKRNLKIK